MPHWGQARSASSVKRPVAAPSSASQTPALRPLIRNRRCSWRAPRCGVLDGRVEVELPEGTLSVVSKSALLEMKRLAGRPQDLADLAALEALPDAP